MYIHGYQRTFFLWKLNQIHRASIPSCSVPTAVVHQGAFFVLLSAVTIFNGDSGLWCWIAASSKSTGAASGHSITHAAGARNPGIWVCRIRTSFWAWGAEAINESARFFFKMRVFVANADIALHRPGCDFFLFLSDLKSQRTTWINKWMTHLKLECGAKCVTKERKKNENSKEFACSCFWNWLCGRAMTTKESRTC